MFENPRRDRQARNFTTNVLKMLDLKSSSEQIFSENCCWVPLKLSIALECQQKVSHKKCRNKKTHKRLCVYYFNCGATFHMLLSSDIEVHPGSSAPRCYLCTKTVRVNQRQYICNTRKDAYHANCMKSQPFLVSMPKVNKVHSWLCDRCSLV